MNAKPTANFTLSTTNAIINAPVIFTNASTAGSGTITAYAWNFGSGANIATATTAGPHTRQYSTTGTKTISLTVTNSNTCTATVSKTLTVASALAGTTVLDRSTDEVLEDSELKPANDQLVEAQMTVFPNPATSEVNVLFNVGNEEAATLYLMDFSGKIIEIQNASGNSQTSRFSVEHLPAGSYVVKLIYGDNKTITRSLVKL